MTQDEFVAVPCRPFRPNTALIGAAEEADRNMYVFRRGLAIRAARRNAANGAPGATPESLRCAMMRIDALPVSLRPSDDEPLRGDLAGLRLTVGDLRVVAALA